MGAWGTSLYANDTASDIHGDYVDKLKRGKTNEEATKELIDDNRDIMGDVEEAPTKIEHYIIDMYLAWKDI